MTLASGDLTTLERAKLWLSLGSSTASDAAIQRFITVGTGIVYGKLNRPRIYSQEFTRYFNGYGTNAIVLPEYPVTAISSLQVGGAAILASPLPAPGETPLPPLSPGYGYRFVPWLGDLPGQPTVLEFNGGLFCGGTQNVKVVYTAGYLINNEAQTIPATPFKITVDMPQGLWSRDGGVINATTGAVFTAVAASPATGQYIAPVDTTPGVYTFAAADAGVEVLISYSFIPAVLEEACIQMIAERFGYSSRVGAISKSLGGQETMTWERGGGKRGYFGLPPEIEGLIQEYVNVIPPATGGYV